jgi:hypothetical protein
LIDDTVAGFECGSLHGGSTYPALPAIVIHDPFIIHDLRNGGRLGRKHWVLIDDTVAG